MANIETLAKDIYSFLEFGSDSITSKSYEQLGMAVAKAVENQLVKAANNKKYSPPSLRMSNIGKPDRYLWYYLRQPAGQNLTQSSVHSSSRLFSFMYGAIIEEVMLWLAEQAGHSVTEKQGEVTLGGVVGHKDCRIDGVGIDVKSASNQSYQKFRTKRLKEDDPFGYMHQIAGYFPNENSGFVVANKETGEICVSLYNKEEIPDALKRINHIKEIVKKNEEPQKCYEPKEQGRNKVLSIGCKNCPFKEQCWKSANGGKGLRAFMYSDGVEYFTEVNSEPRVSEVSLDGKKIIKLVTLEPFPDTTAPKENE